MKPNQLERAAWIGAVAALAIATAIWQNSEAASVANGPIDTFSLPSGRVSHPAESLYAAAVAIVESNPFRADRRPADVPFGAVASTTPPSPQPSRVRPPLLLRGVVVGGDWMAVIEGVPGHQGGLLVRRGDVVGTQEQPLRVRSIGRDTVVIQGSDTTWALTIARHQ